MLGEQGRRRDREPRENEAPRLVEREYAATECPSCSCSKPQTIAPASSGSSTARSQAVASSFSMCGVRWPNPRRHSLT